MADFSVLSRNWRPCASETSEAEPKIAHSFTFMTWNHLADGLSQNVSIVHSRFVFT